jgi:hypothetical protein
MEKVIYLIYLGIKSPKNYQKMKIVGIKMREEYLYGLSYAILI